MQPWDIIYYVGERERELERRRRATVAYLERLATSFVLNELKQKLGLLVGRWVHTAVHVQYMRPSLAVELF